MEANKAVTTKTQVSEKESLKGALYSTLIFVGGTIVIFIILLLALFIARI